MIVQMQMEARWMTNCELEHTVKIQADESLQIFDTLIMRIIHSPMQSHKSSRENFASHKSRLLHGKIRKISDDFELEIYLF